MQSETTSSFPRGNCHRSRYNIGRFAKDYLKQGQALQGPDEISSI